MDRRSKRIAAGSITLAIVVGGTGIAIATGGDDDTPLGGSARQRAVAAALAETGGGTVIETEVGDGGAAFGVEVRLDDGTVVEVNLDADFRVIGGTADDDGPGDDEGPGDEEQR
jgi:hypothetical protein